MLAVGKLLVNEHDSVIDNVLYWHLMTCSALGIAPRDEVQRFSFLHKNQYFKNIPIQPGNSG